ncbi:MAG: CvpA family protein [Planctomycetota bacterium]
MIFYDIIMLVVLGAAMIYGYWKGLAWQIAFLASVIVSYTVSVKFREPVSQFLQAEAPWNRIGAMLILFLGTSLLIWIIYSRVAKTLKKNELKGFDRQAGAILGGLTGFVLCMVITMFSVSLLGDKIHDQIHVSRTGRYVIWGIGTVSSIVPQELAKYVDPHVENFENAIGHSVHRPLEDYPQHTYPVEGRLIQDPNLVPPSDSTYSGQWGNDNPQWNTNQPDSWSNRPVPANNNGSYSSGNQWQNGNRYSNSGNLQTPPPVDGGGQWPNIDVSETSRRILDSAIQHGADAARRALNGNNPQR